MKDTQVGRKKGTFWFSTLEAYSPLKSRMSPFRPLAGIDAKTGQFVRRTMCEVNVCKWLFVNETCGEEVRITSVSQAIEMVYAVMEKEMGECVGFDHDELGSVMCILGQGAGTLAFSPNYDKNNHSLKGFQHAVPQSDSARKELAFADETETVSSVGNGTLLEGIDVLRGLVYILEHHAFPGFLKWHPGA